MFGWMRFSAGCLGMVVLTGCVTPPGPLPTSYDMADEEGVVVFQTYCDTNLIIAIQESGEAPGGYFASFATVDQIFCDKESKLHSVALAEGKYYFSQYRHGATYLDYPERRAFKFSVANNEITYIGKLHVDATREQVSYNNAEIQIRPTIHDEGDIARESMRKRYRNLMAEYQFRSSLAKK